MTLLLVRLLRPFTVFGLVTLSLMTGVLQFQENRNFLQDIFDGYFLGFWVAFYLAYYCLDNFREIDRGESAMIINEAPD